MEPLQDNSLSTVSGKRNSANPVAAKPAEVVNMKNIMAKNTMLPKNTTKREVSWTKILPEGMRNEEKEEKRESVLYSDAIKRSTAAPHAPGVELSSRFHGPTIKDVSGCRTFNFHQFLHKSIR